MQYLTEYELLLEKLEEAWRIKVLTEKVSSQILQEIYWPDQDWENRSDFIQKNALNMMLSELELRDILLAA